MAKTQYTERAASTFGVLCFCHLCPNLFKHPQINKQVTTLTKGTRHRFVERCHFYTYTMIRTVVEHGHKVAVATDQHDAVYRLAIDKTYHIHTKVKVKIGFFRP